MSKKVFWNLLFLKWANFLNIYSTSVKMRAVNIGV
jgi:hypothetical protein